MSISTFLPTQKEAPICPQRFVNGVCQSCLAPSLSGVLQKCRTMMFSKLTISTKLRYHKNKRCSFVLLTRNWWEGSIALGKEAFKNGGVGRVRRLAIASQMVARERNEAGPAPANRTSCVVEAQRHKVVVTRRARRYCDASTTTTGALVRPSVLLKVIP